MSSIVIAGDTSGSVTLQAPAVSGSTVLNLPATSGTIQASGAGYTTNGVAYATSTSVLSTGSALTFDGSTLTGTSVNVRLSNDYKVGFGDGTSWYSGNGSTGYLTFGTNNTERGRFDVNGRFFLGQTSAGFSNSNSMAFQPPEGYAVLNHITGTGSGTNYFWFGYNGGSIGTISQNGTTAVAYNTSSDYRLKNTIAPMTGALAKVALLKPCTYKWNIDNSDGEGFIAHELAEVCPHAVNGEKDAIETYVDKDGNEQTRPVYQGIDTSFLVATLTAAIQEQQALITTLTERITALEGV